MDNDTLPLYESLVSFDTPRELRKAYRSLVEAGEDGLLSDGYYALKRPYKDVNAEVRALRRAKKKHLGEARTVFAKDLEALSEDELAAGPWPLTTSVLAIRKKPRKNSFRPST